MKTPNEDELRRYYKRGWELPLLGLCDQRALQRSPFKYRMLPVIDLVRIDPNRDAHVLDVGCGVGTTSILIARRYPRARFTCIDISERQIEAGSAYVRSIGLADRFRFVVGDVTRELPAVDGRVDYVICCEIIEHLVRPEPMLHTLRTIGVDATRYIFSVPLGRRGGDICYRIVDEAGHSIVVDEPVRRGAGGKRCYPFYHKSYTAREAEELLVRCGFDIDRRVFHTFMKHTRLKNYLNRLTGYSYALDRFANVVTRNRFAGGVLFLCSASPSAPAGERADGGS